MQLLNLIEEKINRWLWGLMYLLASLVPKPLKELHRLIKRKISHTLMRIKISPWLLLRKKDKVLSWFKEVIAEIDFKSALGAVESKLKKGVSHRKFLTSCHRNLLIIIHLVKRPFRGLSAEQGLALIFLSMASLIAGLSIFFQSQRIYLEETRHLRAPASVEVIEFDRPHYYKEKLRHVPIYGVRIPVYYPQVNELQTVTIDFNVTLNNRIGRVFLERREFPLRDHLISTLEPVLARYSLNEEGKAIIKEKITFEVQNFLDLHQIESDVTDLTIIYILAN